MAWDTAMYEVRFIKRDGTETLILMTPLLSEAEDTVPAAEHVEYEKAEIWCDERCIRTVYRQAKRDAA